MDQIFAFLKRLLPRSLFYRALMILVVPILILQGVVAFLFIQRHYDGVTEQMAKAVAREINFAISSVQRAEDVEAARTALDRIAPPFGFEMNLIEGEQVEYDLLRRFYDVTGGVIAETLKHNVRTPLAIDLVSYPKHVDAKVTTSKGVMRVLIPRRRMNAANPHLLFVWMASTALALTVIAVIFLHNQVRPIRELARVAQAFGRGRVLSFKPSGADEVRRAGHAFMGMRGRIERQLEQRTRMLSGVSHDLRTPLTRMKLALAMGEDTPETRELARDITEMEHMLEAFLAFARGEGGEQSTDADPIALAEEVVHDARRKGAEITLSTRLETPDNANIEIRRQAVKRCLTNLVDNAAAYGGQVSVTLRITPRFVEFSVEDDGSGIPPDRREEMLKPFTRLDEARGQNIASGVGLGLSIALDIARSHGGSLTLDDSERMGGLKVSVVLPR